MQTRDIGDIINSANVHWATQEKKNKEWAANKAILICIDEDERNRRITAETKKVHWYDMTAARRLSKPDYALQILVRS